MIALQGNKLHPKVDKVKAILKPNLATIGQARNDEKEILIIILNLLSGSSERVL